MFVEAVNSALFQSPFIASYGKLMLTPPAQVGATLKLGAKDTGLFRKAAEMSGVGTPLPCASGADRRVIVRPLCAAPVGWIPDRSQIRQETETG